MTTLPSFEISASAAKRIAYLITKESSPDHAMLRIRVDGGGCSGFQYHFEFDTHTHNDDCVFQRDEISVVIDTISLEFIRGSMLDYIETLGAAHFEIKNPNATATCGCGNSFAV